MVFSLSSLWWRRIRGLRKLPDGRDWQRGKLGLVLMGRARLNKSSIQFSVDGWSCVPSLLFTWDQEMATRYCTLAWKTPWTEEPVRLQSMESQRVGHDWVTPLSLSYGGGNEDNGDLPQKVPGMYHYTQCPQPCSRPPSTHASTGDSWTLTGKSGSVSFVVTAPCWQVSNAVSQNMQSR